MTVSGAADAAGNALAAPVSWTFATEDTSIVTIFGATIPATPSAADTSVVELGMKFRSTVAGQVLGVRFYKGWNNTGVHVGKLWTADGTDSPASRYSAETVSGWQSATFTTPVVISADTGYVVSYLAPAGG